MREKKKKTQQHTQQNSLKFPYNFWSYKNIEPKGSLPGAGWTAPSTDWSTAPVAYKVQSGR